MSERFCGLDYVTQYIDHTRDHVTQYIYILHILILLERMSKNYKIGLSKIKLKMANKLMEENVSGRG